MTLSLRNTMLAILDINEHTERENLVFTNEWKLLASDLVITCRFLGKVNA
jgi:hypothetical protein